MAGSRTQHSASVVYFTIGNEVAPLNLLEIHIVLRTHKCHKYHVYAYMSARAKQVEHGILNTLFRIYVQRITNSFNQIFYPQPRQK